MDQHLARIPATGVNFISLRPNFLSGTLQSGQQLHNNNGGRLSVVCSHQRAFGRDQHHKIIASITTLSRCYDSCKIQMAVSTIPQLSTLLLKHMKNAFYSLLLILVQLTDCSIGYGQTRNNPHSFLLTGTIEADTGTVLLLPMGGKDFTLDTTNTYSAKIKQGRFTFDGTLAYPTGFVIAFFPNYVSSPFILEAGTQSIVCRVDSVREVPAIDNRSMRELNTALVNFFSRFVLSVKQRRLLLNYVKQHPDSYVGLWETVRQVNEGYAPILDSVFASFSASLQRSYTGKVMAQRLASSKATATGQVFPTLNLLDTAKNPVSIPTQRKATYTLIDFWYARCSACIDQFPKLKALFDTYHPKGFDIAGISIDKQVDTDLWKSTIEKRELVWSQYLDIAGKLTTNQLSIGYFPSNFLLDEQGVIIRKNISLVELGKFLSESL